jgi:TetR/AcrR family transcriptional regulator, cholesterol catabolism regulator
VPELNINMDNRNRILDGAAELFKTYGIKSVTMDTLANHLGISKRTIYEIFADKDEILRGVFQLMADRQKALFQRVMEESENALVAIFKILEFNMSHFQSMSPVFQSDMKRFHQEIMAKESVKCEMPDYRNHVMLIRKGMDENLFRSDINPDLANRCLYSLGKSIMDFDLYPFELFSRREVMKHVFITYLRGLVTPAGATLIDRLENEY